MYETGAVKAKSGASCYSQVLSSGSLTIGSPGAKDYVYSMGTASLDSELN